jgi:septum formation protein
MIDDGLNPKKKAKPEMEKEPRFILASSSPRRAEILTNLGISFEIIPSHVDERPLAEEAPADYTMRIARAKAIEVARNLETGLVIGADTVVVMERRLIGKPVNDEDASRILRLLSGGWHAVMTGVALYDVGTKRELVDYEKTLVRFVLLTDLEIAWYLASGEHRDKAGAYGIQGKAGLFVDEIAGNYHNVVGLPMPLVYRLAKRLGYTFLRG